MKITARDLVLVSQLQDEGIPVDGEVLEEMRAACGGLAIMQDPIIIGTSVFDLDCGGTGYMLSIAIHNESQRSIGLHQPWLIIPWWEPEFHWLVDPLRKSPREYAYWFSGSMPGGFERDMVVNHRLGRRDSRLDPGDWLEGLLLGVGREPIPEEYHDRQRLEMLLSICDGRSNRYELNVAFRVSRMKRRSRDLARKIAGGTRRASLAIGRSEVAA